ncbi:hypothetical protein LYSIN_02963 [Lysinibacillus sphaericus]|uniref:Uncharacterized protein n=1 Tax=Lysinibacillus sphaericus TaxID=1421 RepID=A0A2S5D527_LYSSH|nr:hypothetical protein LYSIN_02963 [Lysinibacillus sphaericus]
MKKMGMFRICLESFFIMNENLKGGEAILYSRRRHTPVFDTKTVCVPSV